MSVYEDYDGSEQPTKRPVSYPKKSRHYRTAWLLLLLLYMSGCSYLGWQAFLRPGAEFAESDASIIVAETESLVANDHAVQKEGGAAFQTNTAPQMAAPPSPPAAPSSKPASVKSQKRKKNGRPLDKMEAETGLIYETDRASPASVQAPQHKDREGLGTQTDRADPNQSVEVDFPKTPQIDQRDIPSATQAERGVSVQQSEKERRPDLVVQPEPILVPEQVPENPPPPVYEVESAPELPPIGQENEIVVLSESPPPMEQPAQPVIYVEPTPAIMTPPPFQPVFDYGGSYVVQIASFSNVEVACSVWDDLRYQHPILFGDAETIVRPHRTNSGHLLHRLRVGAFSKRRHASDWCAAYKAVGGECFITRRS